MYTKRESYHLVDLLPQSADGQLVCKKQKLSVLSVLVNMLKLSVTALEAFLGNQASKFDAQVGENLCQVRAYQIYFMSEQLENQEKAAWYYEQFVRLEALCKQVDRVHGEFEQLIATTSRYHPALDAKETVKSFLMKQNLLVSLPQEIYFLIMCYFLTFFSAKRDNIPFAIDRKKVACALSISTHQAKKITNTFQTAISKLCCNFIASLAKDIFSSAYSEKILPDLLFKTHEHRSVYPCFESTRIILRHMLSLDVPVFVVVSRKVENSSKGDKLYFYFEGNHAVQRFSFRKLPLEKQTKAIVIYGNVFYKDESSFEQKAQYANRFLSRDLEDLLLQNTAAHPQYPKESTEELNEDPYQQVETSILSSEVSKQWHHAKRDALVSGCTIEQQSLFFLKHVFCHSNIQQLYNSLTLDNAMEVNGYGQDMHLNVLAINKQKMDFEDSYAKV